LTKRGESVEVSCPEMVSEITMAAPVCSREFVSRHFEVCPGETLTIDSHAQKFIGIDMPVRLAEINILIETTGPGGASRQQIGASGGDIGIGRRRGTPADRENQILGDVALAVVVKKRRKGGP